MISLRAGDGRDLRHVPAGPPRVTPYGPDWSDWSELDPRNPGAASDPARRAHLEGVEAMKGDASLLVWTRHLGAPGRVPLICR
jgi:hypothetical protein